MLRAGLPLLLLCSKCRILVRCAAVRYSPPHILSTLCSAISPTHIPSSTLSSVLRLCRIFSSVAQNILCQMLVQCHLFLIFKSSPCFKHKMFFFLCNSPNRLKHTKRCLSGTNVLESYHICVILA